MKRVYLLPNILTAFSLTCGLFVIFKINMIEPGSGNYEVVFTSAIILLIASLADFADGALARVLRAESEFGFEFDTLADAVSFGVAPSVLLLKTLSLEQGTVLSFFAASGCMIYSLCGILRLVRFNVRSHEAKGNVELMQAQKKHFTGLPIPASCGAAISANLIFLSPLTLQWMRVSPLDQALILIGVMIFLGYLMVCPLKFPSLKLLRFKLTFFYLAILTVFSGAVFFYGIRYFFPIVLALIFWGYIAIALFFSLIRAIAGKKSKTLEEFEPDFEDSGDASSFL